MRSLRALVLLLLTGLLLGGGPGQAQTSGYPFELFGQYLEALRRQAGIPGLSAAIVSDGRIAWEAGLGLQHIDRVVVATPDTPYPLVDLTQTFTAVLVLQCAERGLIDLEDRIGDYVAFPEPEATIRNVLGHASRGSGTRFQYEPDRFAALGGVVEECHGAPFRRVLATEILDRAGMRDSVPGHDLEDPSRLPDEGFDSGELDRYGDVLRRVAQSYRLERRDRPVPWDHPPKNLSAAAGVVSTVRDLALFDAALDDGSLLEQDSLALAWTNVASPGGLTHPMGLGWFVQNDRGERVVWHFGRWRDSSSAFMLKIPARGLTLIMLANSDGLTEPFALDSGDVNESPFARLFLQLFL
jgi:CubicO group peptidase (beta-lactamase class C family)